MSADGTPEHADSVVRRILLEEMRVPRAQLDHEASLVDDLELDSLGLIELRQILEDRYQASISDQRALEVRTVGDLVTLVSQLERDAAAGAAHAGGSR